MKVIISHDVDHITAWEHRKDLIVPKFVARNLIEAGLGYVSFPEFMSRLLSIARNKWQNIEELMEFDRENGVPSTFFIAVSNGRSLNYSAGDAGYWIQAALERGFGVGLHGIAFNNYADIREEKASFERLSKRDDFGVRIHNIGHKPHSVSLSALDTHLLNKAGYVFSSNVFGIEDPYKTGGLWEFPIHIMDGYLFQRETPWQDQTVEQVKQLTQRMVDEALSREIRYFNVLFHDVYFSRCFKGWRDWYCWFIDYCRRGGLPFVDYVGAVRELELQRQTAGTRAG